MNEKPRSVVIVGSGLAGLSCALALGRAGRDVIVIEERGEPGGRAAEVLPLKECPPDPGTTCRVLLEEISALPNVKIRLGSRVAKIREGSGDFVVEGSDESGPWRIRARAVVLATGDRVAYEPPATGQEWGEPHVFSFTSFEKVLSLPEQEKVRTFRGKRVGFLLDLSTTDSRSFVTRALKYAAHLNANYGVESYVFCRDVQVCGYRLESLYRRSRASGTVVVKYEGSPPRVATDPEVGGPELGQEDRSSGDTVVYLRTPSLGDGFGNAELAFPVDILVVDEAIVGANSLDEFKDLFGLLDVTGGRFQARNPRLEPADTARPGVWVIGTCRGDLDIEEVLAEARSAANRVDLWLSLPEPEPYVAIDAEKCARCLTCVCLCPSKALRIEPYASGKKSAAYVDRRSCRGCGLCASVCPARAITFLQVTDERVLAEVKSLGGRG